MFIDEAQINVRSGKGGDGAVHFRREKFVPRGGPDGGDGGRGGDVILKVQHTLNTLNALRYTMKFIADEGGNGARQKMTGRSAKAKVILVPPGTIVYDADSGELLGDLVERDQEMIVCKGGRGGRGNVHFVSARHQVPRTGEKGEPGEEKNLRLELKLLADVGIVGVPNAGKSSFLAAVSNAKPKIADYPFTTLEPNLGVVELDYENSLVLADIPGLIEGAHMGAGLGDAFLRHIQRTKVLIHVLDGMAEDPIADFSQINAEMALFDPALKEKAQVVVFNKMDIPEVQERWGAIQEELVRRGYVPMSISAMARQDVNQVLWKALELVQKAPEQQVALQMPTYRPEEDPSEFSIVRENEGYRVISKGIERAAKMTYWEHDGSLRRFQKLIESLGVEDALRAAGIKEGDSVFVAEFEMEWQD
ncbi:MAG: GTPase ObgE [Chloroflexi bacterium HGW-Chloroflexi-10]|nr:MAG: GTPase ObgE [Chloroflexi bacterium HGW-Chloroflexi-10]